LVGTARRRVAFGYVDPARENRERVLFRSLFRIDLAQDRLDDTDSQVEVSQPLEKLRSDALAARRYRYRTSRTDRARDGSQGCYEAKP